MKNHMKIKKVLALAIAMLTLVLCCACGNETARPEPTPNPTPAPTPVPEPTPTPEPESVPGTVRLLKLPVVWTVLNRGDEVDVVGEEDGYYIVELDGRKQYVDSRLVRLDRDAVIDIEAGRTVYAKSKAFIYETALLDGEAVANPALNEEMELLDELKGISYVDYQGIKGYIASELLSETKTSLYQDWGGYSGGGGGAPAGGGGGGADGGEIALGYYVHPRDEHILVKLSGKTDSQRGLVFSDNTEVYVTFLEKDDTVRVVEKKDDYAAILFEDSILVIPGYAVRMKDEDAFRQWTGFAKSGAELFTDYNMKDEQQLLAQNTKLTVIDEFENCFLVETEESTGYIAKDSISETEIAVYWGGGYSDGGGSSGGGGAEWTEPVL